MGEMAVVPNWASIKGVRMDHTATTVRSKEFREGGMEIIGDEWGNDVLFSIGNDKEVAGTDGVEVVLPSGTRENTWLRTSGTWSSLLGISVHSLGF